jgi:transcriptional regulator with XRE-family HTH domain
MDTQIDPRDLPDHFGDRIDAVRLARGMSVFELTVASRVNETNVRKYIKGEIIPGLEKAFALAVALNVSLDLLVGEGRFR